MYSERLTGIEKESEQKDSTLADPAQFDPFELRNRTAKEIEIQEEEEELLEVF